ncbi:MAG: Abi family protein [Corynebacterium sp.]|nr:Abi family protein [Corynebacterium sp.]
MNDILEYSEAYIVEQLYESSKAKRCELPKRCRMDNWELCQELSKDLPLWSVVDSFSLGRLVKLIQRCDKNADDKERIWRTIAANMEVPAGRFEAGMESLRSLRNLVCHQSRLWMRPTTYTVTKKGQFHKKIDRCHKKSNANCFL